MAASMDCCDKLTLSTLFKLLKALITPANSSQSLEEGASDQLLDQILHENLKSFESAIANSEAHQAEVQSCVVILQQWNKKCSLASGTPKDDTTLSIRHIFSDVCICLLQCMRDHLLEAVRNSNVPPCSEESTSPAPTSERKKGASENIPELSPDALSVQQEKLISAAIQFVVVLGVIPYLTPGVGLPVSQRLGPGQILLATTHDYSTELKDLDRIQCLLPITKLFSCMLDVPSLKEIVLTGYLADSLTALIQIRYCTRVILQSAQPHRPGQRAVDRQSPSSHVQKATDRSRTQSEIKTEVPSPGSVADKHPTSPTIVVQSSLSKTSLSDIEHKTDEIRIYPEDNIPDLYLDCQGHQWTLGSVIKYCNIEIDRAIRGSSVTQVLTVLMMLSGRAKPTSGPAPKTPPWFRNIVAATLRDVILVSPGLQQFILLFVGDSSATMSHDWQKCKALAQIISRFPVSPKNLQHFYTSVSQQLLEILCMPEVNVPPHMLRAVGATILELTNQQPELMDKMCLSVLRAPVMQLSAVAAIRPELKEGETVITEEELTSCIVSLHRLFILGQEPQSSLAQHLHSIIGVLFFVFVVARMGVSTLRSPCKELIKTYLKNCSTSQAMICLLDLTLSGTEKTSTYYPLHSDVSLTAGPSGGLQAVITRQKPFETDSWTQPVEAVVDILADLNSESETVTSELFLSLLQKLTDLVTSETTEPEVILPARVLSPDDQHKKMLELKQKILLVSLLAAIGEKFGAQVITSSQHVLTFVKATLERCVRICSSTVDDTTQAFEWETVSMAMGLLTAVLGGGVQLTDADKKMLDELLPVLTAIADSDAADPTVREMADDLKVAVATRGLVWAQLSQMRSERKEKTQPKAAQTTEPAVASKPLIQVLSETTVSDEELPEKCGSNEVTSNQAQSTAGGETVADQARVSKLEQALQELCDPMLPVRGHGLISLARLVEERDAQVMGKQDILLKVFLENISHTDSYIYLAAVNGLAALADLCPDQVIPCLTSEFWCKCNQQSVKSGEMTLKVGEALVKATKRLGELTPKYRDQLLSAMLCGCRHDDALVRASSLSGLADTCKLLRFSVGPVLHEILTCCRDVMSSDPDPEPRKAATLTLTLLLQGLGKDSLMALPDVMRDIYHVLKHSLINDADEKVRFQANLALGELDDIMREVLFAQPELQKTITILGYQ